MLRHLTIYTITIYYKNQFCHQLISFTGENTMVAVIVTYRPQITANGDYHACIEGHSEFWGCGKSPAEAIGNLIQAYPAQFEITIKIKESKE